jgi:2-methylisocitrate lyase-like PEP mutase family enzyme
MKPSARLRKMLDNGDAVVVPGVDDPLAAKMARELGFKAVYVGSFSNSARMLGMVDAGYITQTEMAQRVRYICEAVPDMIVFADGEHGFGNPLSLKRTINLFEHAGASGMQFNDTSQDDSRCPFIGLPDTDAVPIADMQAKIRFANAGRTDPDFLVYCPAKGSTMDEKITRARAYLGVGAGSVFGTWKDRADLKAFADGLKDLGRPLKVSCYPFVDVHPSVQELTAMGYQLIYFVLHTMYAAAQAEHLMLRELAETGNVMQSLARSIPHQRLLDVLGIDDVKREGLEFEEGKTAAASVKG